MTTNLPCCDYEVQEGAIGPVYWNPYNKVVQCHNCGQVYILPDNFTRAAESPAPAWTPQETWIGGEGGDH